MCFRGCVFWGATFFVCMNVVWGGVMGQKNKSYRGGR